MGVKRVAAVVTVCGALLVVSAVGWLFGGAWALFTAGGLLMGAGVWNLIQE